MENSPRHILKELAGDIVEHRMQAENDREPVAGPPNDLPVRLSAIGFGDSTSAAGCFFDVALRLCVNESGTERFVDLTLACLDAPSPVSALTNLRRFLDNAGSPAVFLDTIEHVPPAISTLITTFGSSMYMADIIIRNPGYLYWLLDSRTWEDPDTVESYTDTLRNEAGLFRSADARLNAIRRTHRRLLLKIGVRDLLGDAPVEQTARHLSNLAEAVLGVVLDVVASDFSGPPGAGNGGGFAVIALGKLGGRELNYSSDIDLIYVCEDTDDKTMTSYVKLAQAYTSAFTEMTAESYLYRVDLRLRPDGQSGPLVANETSMRIYYENRGRPWEFQAMLKARVVAGNKDLGHRLLSVLSSLIFNPSLPYSPLEDIARMRVQIQESISSHERAFNIKLMGGGIRDIEFIVQTFQLLHGHRHTELRETNTLKALAKIENLKLVENWEGGNLASAYRFFRLVEHRLQMMHQIKTHSVPDTPEEIALLARRVSKGPVEEFTTESFLETLSKHLNNVRTFSDSFFAGEDIHPHSILLLLPENDDRANAIITQYGITDVRRAMHVLHTMAYGSFPKLHNRSTRSAFEELLPYLLENIAETGNPDGTLVNVSLMAEASRSEAAFYRLLKDSPSARRRIVAVAGCSGYLTRQLCNQMDYFEPFIREPMPSAQGTDRETPGRGASARRAAAKTGRLANDWRNKQRAWLDRVRIAGFLQDHNAGRIAGILPGELTRSVQTLVTDIFDNSIGRKRSAALFVFGSYAVGEPRLFSDLDVIVVSTGTDTAKTTTEVQRINRWLGESNIVKLDFRLRGEGASAPLVQDIDFYQQYFEKRISQWEKIAFAKCRHWWGCDKLAFSFFEALRSTLDRPFTPDEISSLLRSRKSIETLAPKTHKEWETKRSAGGRYDIEYLTAIGLAEATPGELYDLSLNTYGRLAVLVKYGIIDDADFRSLVGALTLFTETEYLMELQELTLPRSDSRAKEIERYLLRSFEYWGSDKDDGVAKALVEAKATVRDCFDRFTKARI